MASKSIDIIISTVLKKTGIDAAGAALKKLGTTAAKNLMNIKAGFDMAASAVKTFAAAMSKGMEFERMTTQFKTLVGSMDAARSHMKDLQDLGRTPPFDLESFAAASREMLKMTNGVAGFKKEMEIVGDMAAATGNDIRSVAHAFGLAYQSIRDGQGFGRAGSQLVQLGVLTKKQVEYFDDLSKSGKNNAEVWNELSEVFNRYKGAMADTEKTTKGVVEAIQGEANVALTEFSKALTDAASPALEGLLGWLRQINEDGTIEDWAERSGSALSEMADNAKTALSAIGDGISWLYERLGISDLWHGANSIVQGSASAIGTLIGGGSLSDASRAYDEEAAKEIVKGYYGNKLAQAGFFGEEVQDLAKPAETAEERRERIRTEKAKKRAEEKAKAEADAQKRMEEDLARAQEENDRRAAEKKAEEDKKAAEKVAKEKAEKEKESQRKLSAEIAAYQKSGTSDSFDDWLKKREAAQDKELEGFKKYLKERGIAYEGELNAENEDFKNYLATKRSMQEKSILDQIKAENGNADKQKAIASAAQSEFDKAFAMYRDRDLAARTIAEERDYAADYKQFQRDASRYGGKWRIDELSRLMAAGDTAGQAATLEEWRKSSRFTPEVESLVRAAAADQTRTTAEDELRKINGTLEKQKTMLENLLTMKGE